MSSCSPRGPSGIMGHISPHSVPAGEETLIARFEEEKNEEEGLAERGQIIPPSSLRLVSFFSRCALSVKHISRNRVNRGQFSTLSAANICTVAPHQHFFFPLRNRSICVFKVRVTYVLKFMTNKKNTYAYHIPSTSPLFAVVTYQNICEEIDSSRFTRVKMFKHEMMESKVKRM